MPSRVKVFCVRCPWEGRRWSRWTIFDRDCPKCGSVVDSKACPRNGYSDGCLDGEELQDRRDLRDVVHAHWSELLRRVECEEVVAQEELECWMALQVQTWWEAIV